MRKTLLRFGTPVQWSVFECDLTTSQLAEMRKAVNKVIQRKVDNVRFYQLCRECADRVETYGGEKLTEQHRLYVV